MRYYYVIGGYGRGEIGFDRMGENQRKLEKKRGWKGGYEESDIYFKKKKKADREKIFKGKWNGF